MRSAEMLIVARSLRELSFCDMMAVYEEANRENGEEFWPELTQVQQILRAEQDFLQYLIEVFFPFEGSVYCIWQIQGCYVSALRLSPFQDGMLMEALETAPGERRKGYASSLIRAVQELLAENGHGKLYSHVHMRNIASLGVHEVCGFRRTMDYSVYADGSVNDVCCTLVYEY